MDAGARCFSRVGRGEDLAEATHVQLAGCRAPVDTFEVGPEEGANVDESVRIGADTLGDAAAPLGPRAGERRKTAERAEEHRTVLVVLGTDQRPDARWSNRRVVAGELLDDAGVDTGHVGGSFGSPIGDALAQFVVARGVFGDPRVVREPVTDDHVHHRQHHGDVGSWERLDELVTSGLVDRLGGHGADRIDDDEACASFASQLDGGPQVAVRQPGVRAPQQDQLRVFEFQRVHAAAGAVRHAQACADRGSTDGPKELRGPHVREEPGVDPHHGEEPLVAGVGEGEHGLGAVLGDRRVQPLGDLVERFGPRDHFELARSLGTDSAEWVQDAVGVVHAVDETVHLRAQLAGGVGMVGVAA